MATTKLSKSDVIRLMAATAPFIKSATLSGLCSSRWVLMLSVQTEPVLRTDRVQHLPAQWSPTATLTTSCNLWCRSGRTFWRTRTAGGCGWGWCRRLWRCLLPCPHPAPQQRHWLQSKSHRSHRFFWSPSGQKDKKHWEPIFSKSQSGGNASAEKNNFKESEKQRR